MGSLLIDAMDGSLRPKQALDFGERLVKAAINGISGRGRILVPFIRPVNF